MDNPAERLEKRLRAAVEVADSHDLPELASSLSDVLDALFGREEPLPYHVLFDFDDTFFWDSL